MKAQQSGSWLQFISFWGFKNVTMSVFVQRKCIESYYVLGAADRAKNGLKIGERHS